MIGLGLALGMGLAVPSVAPFSPLSRSPTLWLDGPTALSVSAWTDQSGNGNNFAQASAGKQPVVTTSTPLGSKQAARFDGVDDYMGSVGSLVQAAPWSLYICTASNDAAQTAAVIGSIGDYPMAYAGALGWFAGVSVNIFSSAGVDTNGHALLFQVSGGTGHVFVDDHTTEKANGATGGIDLTGTMTIGAANTSSVLPMKADVGSVILIPGLDNASQRQAMFNYFATRFGVSVT